MFNLLNCLNALLPTSRCRIHDTPTALHEATGVFRAVTECHCGPTKGGESPTLDGGPTRGGMDLQVNSVLLANPFHRPWRQHLASSLHTKTCKFTTVLIEPTAEGICAHSSRFCQFVFIHRFHAVKLLNFRDLCKFFARFFHQ